MAESIALAPVTTHLGLQVKNWFSDHQQIFAWGGPDMAFPISDKEFIQQLMAQHFSSYCLLDAGQQLLAFGQHYRRLGHHHLSRLVVNPAFRGQGMAKILIKKLLAQAFSEQPAKGASLFVFTDNLVAHQCYRSLGFVETQYPEQTFPGNMQNCIYMVLSTLSKR